MVKITARIQNSENQHGVLLKTGDNEHSLIVEPKASGFGSSMNGGEALVLAIATCYCNDIYREAAQQGIKVKQVVVEVDSDYDGVAGHPIENIMYHVTVEADAAQDVIENLIRLTDTVAEIHNTLRQGTTVTLKDVKGISLANNKKS